MAQGADGKSCILAGRWHTTVSGYAAEVAGPAITNYEEYVKSAPTRPVSSDAQEREAGA